MTIPTTAVPAADDDADDYHVVDTTRYDLPTGGAQFVSHCDRHHTRGLLYSTASEAYENFACDPLRQQFIVASGDGESPRVTDLGGLRAMVRGAIKWAHLCDESMPQLFRWSAAAPHLEPLTHPLVRAGSYNDEGFATDTYGITTASGQTIIEFSVTIDGNA